MVAGLFAASLGGGPVLAQSVIATQPLPPPAGIPTAPPPQAPVLIPPASHHVPTVKPSPAPVKAAPHRAKPKQAAKPVAKPGAKPAAKPVTKAAARPAEKPAAPPASPAPAAAPPPKIDPNKGTTTGLPLPRWAAFRSDEVNLRSGPGMQYPIDWVYHRRDLPVHILREFAIWRLVEEQDGTKGWVHEATLTGRRGYVVQDGEQVLRNGPAETADAVAQLEPGVVGSIRRCPAASVWCEVQAGAFRGWLKRAALYGISPGEIVQ